MALRLRERLLAGFFGIAFLVLLAGGSGILLIERVSTTSNHVLEEKIPLQDTAAFLMLSVEKSIALSRDYVLNLDLDEADEILDELDTEAASVDNLLLFMEGEVSIAAQRDRVAELHVTFSEAVERLVAAHDRRVPYWFLFDGRETDLKTFVLQQRIALNDWLTALGEAARFDAPFTGNLDLEKSDYERWYRGYEVDDPMLARLLKKYASLNKKIFRFASKVEKANGSIKLSHFQRGESRQIGKAKRGLDAIVNYVTPIVDQTIRDEREAVEEMNRIAAGIEMAIHELRLAVENEVRLSRDQVAETQSFAWTFLLSSSVAGVVLAVLIALYIARSVVNPVNRLRSLMSRVSDEGDFSHRIDELADDEVGETAATLNTLLDSLQGAIGEIGGVMSASAGGDFSRRVESELSGELDQLKQSVNGSVEQIQDAINRVNGVMQAVESGDYELRIEEAFDGELHTFRNAVNGALDSLQQMTENLSLVMLAIVSGDFSHRMSGAGSEIEQSVNRAMESMEGVVESIARVMERTAVGDLSQSVEGVYPGQLAALTASINESLENQRKIVGNVRSAARLISHESSEIASGNNDLSQRTTEQATSLEETAASLEEMASTVKMNAGNAAQANELATSARTQAEGGAIIVSDTITAMGRISDSSRKISEIITLIDGIAFQTNLLALNAAVEAARAGEHGRGFAVVAGEVRTLAQRSADAARDIKQLIEDSASRVEEGSDLVEQSGEALQSIQESVKRVNDIVSDIAAASKEQSTGVDLVNTSIARIAGVNQQNSAMVEEAAAASQAMDQQARELARMVELFQLGEAEGHHSQGDGAEPQPPAEEEEGGGVEAAPPAEERAKPARGEGLAQLARQGRELEAEGEWHEF